MHSKIVIPSLPTTKPSSSSSNSSLHQQNPSSNHHSSSTNGETIKEGAIVPHHSIQLRKSLFQQEIPLHYHSTFSSTHLLSQIKNASLFQQPVQSNTNNPYHTLIGNNHKLVQVKDNHFILTTIPKPKQPQQNTGYVDRYARATEIDAEDREMLTEVASVLNKIIYYVTLDTTLDENMDLMNQMENFQKQCWDLERQKFKNTDQLLSKKQGKGSNLNSQTNGTSNNTYNNTLILAPTSGNSHHFFLGANNNNSTNNSSNPSSGNNTNGNLNGIFNSSNPSNTINSSQPISPRSKLRKHDEFVKENMIPEWDTLMQPLKGKQSYLNMFPPISQSNDSIKTNPETQQQNIQFFARLHEISFLQIESIKLEKKERKSKFI